MRKTIIAANWKENKENSETADFLLSLKERITPIEQDIKNQNLQIIIAPSYVSLVTAYDITRDSDIKIASQNMFYEDSGAYTGEISPLMIKNFCNYVILGHSERRHIFNEDNETIKKKLNAAIKHGLKPILCIGETRKQKDEGRTFETIREMLDILDEADDITPNNFIVAYEPVWAISCGKENTKPATPEDAQEAHAYIRKLLHEKFNDKAMDISILYGGSVKPENIKTLMAKDYIDGVLVGNASLQIESFEKLIKSQLKENNA